MTIHLPASRLHPADRARGVTLVLGPTNTGKTHYAIERMLAHGSGMIGLPLRLLAREVYNRVVERVGPAAVALVTGEEKIKPKNPAYWVSTVEAMPRDLDLAFVAVDEIQLATSLDRGHVFTDRILNRRGREETLLIGASTVQRALTDLLPGVHVATRPRLSTLTFAGERKIARLPRRSAIVAFSAEEVYAIAEWIRRQRGGAAVVLGALSPRTRNAQVAMYQNGDVDYIVATDAIGMGLNLDVDHIAFAGDRKFDGWHYRRLHAAEFGQIAGRAGRHLKDGTFGSTGRCPPFEPELVEALEEHRFEPVRLLQWRNADLDFSSLAALSASLDQTPGEPGLARAPLAVDQLVLDVAARDDEVQRVARNRGDIARLWDACQIPDYRKVSPAAHADTVLSIYRFVMRAGRIPDDWFARHVEALDRVDGDLDALSARIAQIRTWTFVANRPDWLRDPEHWQGVTRRVEDTLSDALHERLAQRFVDRRTSVLMRRLRENADMEAEITTGGDVLVESQHIGTLNGFRFTPDPQATGEAARALNAAAQKALASEIEGRATRVHEAVDEAFVLANDGLLRWLGEPIGRIGVGAHMLEPVVRVLADEQLTGVALENVQRRLDLWLAQHVKKLLGALADLEKGEALDGVARGIAFQIAEALGVLERSRVADDVKGLSQEGRAALRKLGVRFGAYHLYLPALLKPAPRALAAQLWALRNSGVEGHKGADDVPYLAASGRTSFVADKDVAKGFYRAAGFRVCGERAVRVDILERLADLIRPAIAYHPGTTPGDPPTGAADRDGFVVTVAMTSLVGCSGEQFASILRALGYVSDKRPGPAITVPLLPKAAVEPVRPLAAAPSPEEGAAATDASSTPVGEPSAESADESGAPSDGGSADTEISSAAEPGSDVPVDDAPTAPDVAADPAPEPVLEEAPATQMDLDAALPDRADVPSVDPDGATEAQTPAVQDHDAPAPVKNAAEANELPTDAAESAAASAEIPLIDVWRPHRQGGARRPDSRGKDNRARARGPRTSPLPNQVPDQPPAPAGEGAPARVNRPGRGPRTGEAFGGASGGKRPEGRREARPDGGRRGNGGPDAGRHGSGGGAAGRGDDRRAGRTPSFVSSEAPRRDRAPDPNSPFAKLAALKEQMEKDRK